MSKSVRRGRYATASRPQAVIGMARRLFALTAVCCLALPLASCSTVSGVVSDHWPHWAGGMPDDVPPRPGAPGYEEFIAHKPEAKDAAAPGATPVAQKIDGLAEPATAAPRPNQPPNGSPPADQNAGQGGLY
jgi:hypothetical protein